MRRARVCGADGTHDSSPWHALGCQLRRCGRTWRWPAPFSATWHCAHLRGSTHSRISTLAHATAALGSLVLAAHATAHALGLEDLGAALHAARRRLSKAGHGDLRRERRAFSHTLYDADLLMTHAAQHESART